MLMIRRWVISCTDVPGHLKASSFYSLLIEIRLSNAVLVQLNRLLWMDSSKMLSNYFQIESLFLFSYYTAGVYF